MWERYDIQLSARGLVFNFFSVVNLFIIYQHCKAQIITLKLFWWISWSKSVIDKWKLQVMKMLYICVCWHMFRFTKWPLPDQPQFHVQSLIHTSLNILECPIKNTCNTPPSNIHRYWGKKSWSHLKQVLHSSKRVHLAITPSHFEICTMSLLISTCKQGPSPRPCAT